MGTGMDGIRGRRGAVNRHQRAYGKYYQNRQFNSQEYLLCAGRKFYAEIANRRHYNNPGDTYYCLIQMRRRSIANEVQAILSSDGGKGRYREEICNYQCPAPKPAGTAAKGTRGPGEGRTAIGFRAV